MFLELYITKKTKIDSVTKRITKNISVFNMFIICSRKSTLFNRILKKELNFKNIIFQTLNSLNHNNDILFICHNNNLSINSFENFITLKETNCLCKKISFKKKLDNKLNYTIYKKLFSNKTKYNCKKITFYSDNKFVFLGSIKSFNKIYIDFDQFTDNMILFLVILIFQNKFKLKNDKFFSLKKIIMLYKPYYCQKSKLYKEIFIGFPLIVFKNFNYSSEGKQIGL